MITVQELSHGYGTNLLIDNASFFLAPQARMGLVGANGTGKTTLLRLLAGLDLPDAGQIIVQKGARVGLLAQHEGADYDGTVWQAATSAFEPAWKAEAEMRRLEQQMQQATGQLLDQLVEQHTNLLQRFEQLGGYEAESRCAGALIGLGLPRDCWQQPVGTLSGGQLRRLGLARLLLQRPDVLLLDEPTNHLDLSAMQYLEGVLRSWQGPVVCVSHDRWFMDAVCTQIAELSFKKLTMFNGNYSDYLLQSEALYEQRMRAYKLQQREIARQEAIIARYRMFNREKSIRAAASRQKQLDRVQRLEKPPEMQELQLAFPPPPHLGYDALRAEGLQKSFDGRPVITGIDLLINAGDRLAIIGPNGCGKTTLMRMLCGQLPPDAGMVTPGAGLRVGWFDQQQRTLGKTGTVLEELRDAYPTLGDRRLRTVLAAFLFPGEDVFTPLSVLSGGERARLMLLKLMLQAPNLLALDEPTNHLDMPSRIALEEALLAWPGTLLFVSHDRFFIDRVATRVLVFEEDGPVLVNGGWQDYLADRARRENPTQGQPVNKTQARREQRAERQRIQARQQHNRSIRAIEADIERLEAEKLQLEQQLAQPELYADHQLARKTAEAYEATRAALDAAYDQWATLDEG